ncbi:MAG: glycosyltransferase family A protein [Candidatus Sulfotelmatobacter sp.]|jgi:glycosyltransferase involved in cell wall biosynthesis
MNSNPSYVVITPVRDEEAYLASTIECVAAQTIPPSEWIIVNDGSKDNTGKIIDDYASRYPWIRGVHRQDRGFRKAGGGVVDAFNDGYRALKSKHWNFIVKLDGDLTIEPDYFEKCFDEFERDHKLGVGGGVICYVVNGVKTFESAPAFHVRGATKIYRKECWDGIGGFWPAPGWDTLDEVKANSLGWSTRSFRNLHLLHHRETGSADGVWPTLVKYGRANYICGYHPLFMVSKCIVRLLQKPYVLGSIGLMYGFVTGYVKRIQQVDDPATIAYLRSQQLSRLRGRQTIWR